MEVGVLLPTRLKGVSRYSEDMSMSLQCGALFGPASSRVWGAVGLLELRVGAARGSSGRWGHSTTPLFRRPYARSPAPVCRRPRLSRSSRTSSSGLLNLSVLQQNLAIQLLIIRQKLPHHSFSLQCRMAKIALNGVDYLSASFLLESGPVTVCDNRFLPVQLPSYWSFWRPSNYPTIFLVRFRPS